jgi:hypothetical protein
MLACHGGGSGPEYMLLQGPLHEVRRHGIVEFRHGSILGGRWLFDFFAFSRIFTLLSSFSLQSVRFIPWGCYSHPFVQREC